MSGPSHALLEHTGETRLLVRGPTAAAVFEEAARGLGALERAGAEATGRRLEGSARLAAPDQAALLVDWLNELLYWSETRRAVPDAATVRLLGASALEASWSGPELAAPPALVKAATHHRLRFEPSPAGWEAEVVLDV